MKKKMRAVGAWMRAKPLFAAALVVIVCQVASLSARSPVSAVPSGLTSRAPVKVLEKTADHPVSAPSSQQTFVVKRILHIDGPFEHGDYVWDDKGVPDGPVVITIDLAAQTLSVFRAGYEIGAAVILYGADDKPTPLGTFSIMEKDEDHVSNLYDAPMPYMLRLTNDGVAIHGSEVEWGLATHGCIGIPTKFAALLFSQAGLGDHVIITKGKMLRVDESPMAPT